MDVMTDGFSQAGAQAPGLRLRTLLIALPPLAGYGALAVLYPALADQIARFAAFFTLFLALPSFVLGLALPLGNRNWAESFFLGYPPTQMLLFLLIFFGARYGAPWLPAALPAACAVALPLLMRTRRVRQAPSVPMAELWLIVVPLTLAVGLCFIKFVASPLPTPGHPAMFYQDDPGTASFIWSAVNAIQYGVPYAFPWASGFPDYPYHRLQHFTFGFATYAAGVRPLEQLMYLWAPAQWMMLVGAVVTGCRRFARFSNLETGMAVVLLLFSDGLTFNSQISIQTISFFHTFFFGLPAFLLLLLSLYGYLGRRSEISPTLMACCYFVAAGVKANLLLFIPLSLLPVFVYRLYRRLALWLDLRLALFSFVSACVLFYTHYSNLGLGQAKSKAFRLWPVLMGTLGNLATMLPVVVPFVAIAIIAADRDLLLRERMRQDRQFHVFLLTFCLAAAIFLKAVNYSGGESYFFWQARLMTLVAFTWLASQALAWRTRVVAPLVAVALVGGISLFTINVVELKANDSARPAVAAAKNIDADEMEGLRWASENLDRRRSFFTNKDNYLAFYLVGYSKTFLWDYLGIAGMQGYAWETGFLSPKIEEAISSRRVWIEKFMAAKGAREQQEALAHVGADYYFHCERQHPASFAGVNALRPVYRNASLTIYEVIHQPTGEAAAQAQ